MGILTKALGEIYIEATDMTQIDLNENMPVGTRWRIRKTSAGQLAISIVCNGHTFTKGGRTDVILYNEGDYWVMEKVSDTRIDLVEGFCSGSDTNETSNRYFKLDYDGYAVQQASFYFPASISISNSVFSYISGASTYNYLYPFTKVYHATANAYQLYGGCEIEVLSTTSCTFRFSANSSQGTSSRGATLKVTGVWY